MFTVYEPLYVLLMLILFNVYVPILILKVRLTDHLFLSFQSIYIDTAVFS